MNSDPRHARSTDRLPLLVYVALVGLVLWMVLAAWGFAGPGYADVALTVVTGFFVVVIAIPFILWRVSRRDPDLPKSSDKSPGFSEWASGEFEIWQGRVRGSDAAVEIILPIAAAAIGMTALAIVFHYAAMHASL